MSLNRTKRNQEQNRRIIDRTKRSRDQNTYSRFCGEVYLCESESEREDRMSQSSIVTSSPHLFLRPAAIRRYDEEALMERSARRNALKCETYLTIVSIHHAGVCRPSSRPFSKQQSFHIGSVTTTGQAGTTIHLHYAGWDSMWST
jgi:hypothetical protein